MNARVLIYAKAPRMGLSKTRLARGLGKAEARRLARMGFARTLRAALDPRWQTFLYAAPDQDLRQTFGGLWPCTVPRRSQGGGDLGARLARGYRDAPPGAVVFIGADAPDIEKRHIRAAILGLRRHGAVVGPASDGGFWLLGLRRGLVAAHPFDNVRWSSAHTLDDVEANIGAGVGILRLETLIDLDEAEDWKAWASGR